MFLSYFVQLFRARNSEELPTTCCVGGFHNHALDPPQQQTEEMSSVIRPANRMGWVGLID
jgi:hypothetical protein